jgi:hypothetical protein
VIGRLGALLLTAERVCTASNIGIHAAGAFAPLPFGTCALVVCPAGSVVMRPPHIVHGGLPLERAHVVNAGDVR